MLSCFRFLRERIDLTFKFKNNNHNYFDTFKYTHKHTNTQNRFGTHVVVSKVMNVRLHYQNHIRRMDGYQEFPRINSMVVLLDRYTVTLISSKKQLSELIHN